MKTIKFGILATALLAAAQGCSFLDTSLDTNRTVRDPYFQHIDDTFDILHELLVGYVPAN